MAFDWEDILGAEGSDLQDAYDDALERFDRIERQVSTYDADLYIQRRPEDDDDGLPPCDGNYPFCEGDCENCRYCRSCESDDPCDGNCDTCQNERFPDYPLHSDKKFDAEVIPASSDSMVSDASAVSGDFTDDLEFEP